jgi:hypothetical protein
LVFDNSGAVGIVSCQASCVPDDTTTWIACTTGTDCPPARPACAQIASVNGRPFNICEPAPPAMR